MKRRWMALILALCLLVSTTGCGERLSQLVSSDGSQGQEETIEASLDVQTEEGASSSSEETAEEDSRVYQILYEAVDSGESTCRVEDTSIEEVRAAVVQLLKQPELFWLSGCQMNTYTVSDGSDYVEAVFDFRYDEVDARRAELEQRVAALLADMPAEGTDYDKAKAVHDYLITHITYDAGSSGGQDIYAALVEGVCVCLGYANAYAYLLERLGVSCDVITGTGDGESHAWNHVVLNGLDYYTDVTWDDVDQYSASGEEYILYHWFNLTLEDMENRHTAEEGTALPQADTTDYNYFTVENAWLWQYSTGGVKEALAGQLENGTGLLTLRCRSQECYQEMISGLIDQQEIYTVLRELGYEQSQVSYFQEDSLYILTIVVE